MPLNVHLAVEKDKTATCLQGEVHASVVHTVPPWGSRHITQVRERATRRDLPPLPPHHSSGACPTLIHALIRCAVMCVRLGAAGGRV